MFHFALSRRKQGFESPRERQSLFVHIASPSFSAFFPKPSGAFWVFLFVTLFSGLPRAFVASRVWSAPRVYRSASLGVLWPTTAMISCAVHPASASRRP